MIYIIHNVTLYIEKYTLAILDIPGLKTKNKQTVSTIDIYYWISIENNSVIDYNFYKTDFEIWKGLVKFHISNINKWSLYSIDGTINNINDLDNIKNDKEYYNFSLESIEIKLYNKMRCIPYLCIFNEKEGIEEWENMDEQIEINTW